MIGGLGSDELFGGAGADSFVYQAASDSTASAFDVIQDFQSGLDYIDLRAVRTGASDLFTLTTANGSTTLSVDLGGDGVQDMVILLANVTNVQNSDILFS